MHDTEEIPLTVHLGFCLLKSLFPAKKMFSHLLGIQILQNLLGQWFLDLGVPWDSLHRSVLRINPK